MNQPENFEEGFYLDYSDDENEEIDTDIDNNNNIIGRSLNFNIDSHNSDSN
jgi:hypothetical protein